jgi:hypothetical protein
MLELRLLFIDASLGNAGPGLRLRYAVGRDAVFRSQGIKGGEIVAKNKFNACHGFFPACHGACP